MKQRDNCQADLPESAKSELQALVDELQARWLRLCDVYLPFKIENTFWRCSRETKPDDPLQGWKLHISAIVIQACDLLEKVAPFLTSRHLRFKVPQSLQELIELNSGLKYGYSQVGKFITVYPATETEAVNLARELHDLTREFISIAVPFDNRYLPKSSVFYRYGAFENIEIQTVDGLTLPAVKNLSGEFVHDDHFQAVPEWMNDPFQNQINVNKDNSENIETPLVTTYKVFRAITQRGKGGTYQALDLSTNPPRFCILKEGRRHGEAFWNGQDGFLLVRNEHRILEKIGRTYGGVPQVFDSFRAHGNFYLVMEFVEGESLEDLMKFRSRRFSIEQILRYSAELAKIIEEIHKAGWIWNDCKPANIIVMQDKSLKPIDFEGAYPINEIAPFNWRSHEFSKAKTYSNSSENPDLYAFGAVIYYLLTGKYYDSENPVAIKKLRRNVPIQLQTTIENLLDDSTLEKKITASEAREKFEEIFNSI